MLKKIILVTVSLMTVFGCEKNNGKEDKYSDITDYNRSELFQSAKAEQTALRSGFSFTAAGDWAAWCTEDSEFGSADGKEWIYVTPSAGKAGSNTIYITFNKNTAKKMRRGYVNISCGETLLTISIEQEGENSAEVVNYDIVNVFADTESVYNPGALDMYRSGYKLIVSEEKDGKVVIPDWVEISTSQRIVKLKVNDTHASRSAVIELWNGSEFIWLTEIIQSAVCADGSFPL